jgi:hypothetical protein
MVPLLTPQAFEPYDFRDRGVQKFVGKLKNCNYKP